MTVITNPLPSSPAQVDQQTGAISVPLLLQQPTRILRQMATVATYYYWADRVLPNGGGVSGGGVIFDVAQPGDSYSAREPEPIAPLAEFPVSNAAEPIPATAQVAKWGTRLEISDEKRDRNDVRYVQREQVRAANTMVRRLHTNAVAAIDAAVAAFSRTTTWTTPFANVVPVGATQTDVQRRPVADIQHAQAVADLNLYQAQYDTLLVNAIDYATLQAIYPAERGGVDRNLFPEGNGSVIPTNLLVQGTSYLVASNEAGQTRWERPLTTEVWREQEVQATFIQYDTRAVYFVDNPYAVLKLTGA